MASAGKILDKFGDEVDLLCSRPKLASFDGVPMTAQWFPIKYWKQTREYKPRDDDIFIVTYPKSGTTWLQEIFFCLFNGRQPKDSDERSGWTNCYRYEPEGSRLLQPLLSIIIIQMMTKIHKGFPLKATETSCWHYRTQNCPFLEFSGTAVCDSMYRPGALKIHTRFEHSPYAPNAKYVYCVRNPKDCCVSFYYHSLVHINDFGDCDFTEYFEYFMKGLLEFGNYWDHLESWYPMIKEKNVLFLTYEDMKQDILRELARIGKFIGGEWEEKLTGEGAKEIAELSSFKKMKESFDASGRGVFTRKGIIHDWKNHLTDSMSQRIEKETYSRLKSICPELLKYWEDLGVLSGEKS